MSVRLGVIDYLNVQPLYYRIRERLADRDVSYVYGVPTALNRMLVEGEIDIAPISAIETARHAEMLAVVPHLGIATLGAVKTVLLFSWHPDPVELADRVVALSDHSATSVALLKVLYREYYRVTPRYQVHPQDLDAMLAHASAALLIGDDALVEGTHRRPVGDRGVPYVFDLGDEWLKWTGLPFVFALWSVRRDRLDAVRDAGVIEALFASKAEGLAHLDDIARAYAPRLGLEPGVCAKYLRDLRYDLTPEDIQGLLTFLRHALPGWDPNTLTWVGE
ncbi:MAG: menaquinone biosynthesis protein [Chloroflexi bacterium]|nr:menaquinone biosynthesis protein [Chloroflexota bacterium]